MPGQGSGSRVLVKHGRASRRSWHSPLKDARVGNLLQLVLHHEANFVIWNDVGESNHDQWELCRTWYTHAWQMCQAKSIVMLRICFRLPKQTSDLCHDHLEQPAFTEAQYLLGIAYQANGQISKAFETLEHVVKMKEKLAGDHPSRLASQHELAIAYRANGQIKEAVEMLERVVKVQEKLAEDHSSRLASQHALARAYRANGQISKAVEMPNARTKRPKTQSQCGRGGSEPPA
jgi:tetratricopeptide (TPR) repeat protein